MTTLSITNSWPSSLPIPADAFSASPRYVNITSSTDAPQVTHRERYTKRYFTLQATFTFTYDELTTFETFHDTTLGNGTAWFTMDLRFPEGTSVKTWVVRFGSGYSVSYGDGFYVVSATLDLISPETI